MNKSENRKSGTYTRINDILLGPLERPALKWLAAHSPSWVNPDIYTGIGVLGAVVVLIGYIVSRSTPWGFWIATFGFIMNWYGDSLDGTLARYRHIERPIFGFYIDHSVDAITQALVFIGIGLSPYISFNVAMLTLVAYLLLSVLAYVRTCIADEFKISYGKLGPTEARLLAIILNIIMFFAGWQAWPLALGAARGITINPYNLYVGTIGIILLYFFVTTFFRDAIRLGKENR